MLRNQQFRQDARQCFGAVLNAAFAIVNGVIGFSQSLLWEQSMAVYFAILCFMGSYVAACSIKPERHSVHRAMKVCGISIIALAISIAFIKYLIIGESHNEPYHPYVMILMAALTFASAGIAIADVFKTRNDYGYRYAFLGISVASTLGAMTITEMQMLSTFAGPDEPSTVFWIETISGIAFVLILLLIGTALIVKSRRSGLG